MPGPRHARDVPEVHDRHRERGQKQVAELGQRGRRRVAASPGPGSQPSCTPTTTTRIVPVTNSGIEEDVSAEQNDGAIGLVGLACARRRAPPMMATGIVMMSARPASLAERAIAAASVGITGWLVTNEFPKSSVKAPTIESTYRSISGRFVPRRSFSASTLSCGANGPEDRPPDVVRQDVGDDEDDRGEQPQREERQEQPARDETCHRAARAVPSDGWMDEGDGRRHRPHAVPDQATLEVVAKDIWPEGAREDPGELVRVAGQVVVEVRQADRDRPR